MEDLDPAEAASHEDLLECLEQIYIRADRPSLRELEQRTAHRSGLLPRTGLRRVRLGRSAVSEMRRGVKFPKKAFLLTFVEVCGVDIETDRRWEQAWDRLAGQYLNQAGETQAELDHLRQERDELREQLSIAERRADEAEQAAAETRRLARGTEARAVDADRRPAEAEGRFKAAAEATAGDAEADRDHVGVQPAHFQPAAEGAEAQGNGASPDARILHDGDLEGEVSLSFDEAIDGLTVVLPLPGVVNSQARIDIPPAVTDGTEICSRGQGDWCKIRGQGDWSKIRGRGDFYALIEVRPHAVFGRDGDDLTVTVPMTLPELAIGSVIKVPAFRRPPIKIRMPPGTQHGCRFRVRGFGIRRPDGTNGNMVITVRQEPYTPATVDDMRTKLCTKAAESATTVNPIHLVRRGVGLALLQADPSYMEL